jgi:hypothetical protein
MLIITVFSPSQFRILEIGMPPPQAWLGGGEGTVNVYLKNILPTQKNINPEKNSF